MRSRRDPFMFLVTATSVVVLASTIGCSAEPRPTPTATPLFATEDEAFAAAEEVYREYLDAGNARIAGKDSPDPQDYLVGQALEADIDGVRFLEEQGLRLAGQGILSSFEGVDADLTPGSETIDARVCLDATQIRVFNTSGEDATPSDRAEVVAQLVHFVSIDDSLMISTESATPPEQC